MRTQGLYRSLWLVAGPVFAAYIASALPSHAQQCTWRPVERAGINSHQPGPPWCSNGEYLAAFDLDGPRNYAPHDSPVVGQALCCPYGSNSAWRGQPSWTPVGRAGINSHQSGVPWCPDGSYIVAVDLDGPRNYAPHDSPIVGQVLCAFPANDDGRWSESRWFPVESGGINSHQAGRSWCDPGWFLISYDQDGPRNYAPHDSPVVGQAQCARP